jgi:hypothetical protein
MSENRYLNDKEACEYLLEKHGPAAAIKPKSLPKMRQFGSGPVFYKFGRKVGYLPADLDEWAIARRSGPLRRCRENGGQEKDSHAAA